MDNNAALVRALRGPLALILLGVLFLIDYSGGIGFAKTWPVLIIFLGLARLAERALTPELPPPPPYTPGGPQ